MNTSEIQDLLTRGLQAIDDQNFDEALACWERVLELDPKNARAQRLVDDLSLLMSHAESDEATAPDGHDVVIVMDEEDDAGPEFVIELPMKSTAEDFTRSPSMITRNSLDRLRDLLEEQTAENARLNDLVSERYAENLELRERMTFKDRELIEQRAELISLEKRVSSLDVERRNLERYTKQCERQIAEIELSQVEHRRALERVSELETQLQEVNGELASLRTEFNGVRDEAGELRDALQAAEKEKKLFGDKLMKFELQVGSRDKRIKELEKEVEAARNDTSALEELEARAKELEIEVAKLQLTLEARDREIDDLGNAASRAEMLEAESAAKDQDIEALQRDIEAIAEDRDQLSDDLRTVNGEADEARTALREAEAQIERLTQELEAARNDTSALEELEARLERQQALSEAKDAEIAQLYESHSATSARLDEREREFERLVAQVEKADASLREARAENERLRKVDERCDTLELELSEAVAELHSERERADLNDRACRTLEARLSRQNTHLEDLERRLDEPSAGVGMNQLLAQKEQRIEELTNRVHKLEAQLVGGQKTSSATDVTSTPIARDAARSETGLGVQKMETGPQTGVELGARANSTRFGMGDPVNGTTGMGIQNMDSGAHPVAETGDESAGIRGTHTMMGHQAMVDDSNGFIIDMEIVDDMDDGLDDELEADFEVLLEEKPKSGKRQTAQTHAVPHGRHERKTGEQPLNGQDPITRIERIMHHIPRVLLSDPGALESPKEAFVIANIDGNISFADLIDIAGLPAEETGRILVQLIDRGVIEATN